MHIEGNSDRQIAVALGVSKNTVPRMLADSDLLKEHRRQLSVLVPKAIENIEKLLKPSKTVNMEPVAKTTMWLLENTQVGVKKTTADVSHAVDFLAGRTIDEKLFFATHGYWPEDAKNSPSAGDDPLVMKLRDGINGVFSDDRRTQIPKCLTGR
jgi:hypothetical protein